MHGYELRKRLNAVLGPFRALSYGTLYPCLKDLVGRGWIQSSSGLGGEPDAGAAAARSRGRIVYELTAEGKERLQDLLAEAGPAAWEDDSFDVRFAFFARTDAAVRLRILEGRRTRLEERLDNVRAAAGRARDRMDSYTLELQRHGLESAEREVRWLNELIETERRTHDSDSTSHDPEHDNERPTRRSNAWDPSASPSSASGNCAASLVQGVHYYADADPNGTVPGLMHVMFGDYHVRDVEFVAAFDVDAKKVGFDLSEAIVASENNTIKFAEVPPLGVTVQRGVTNDGLGKYYRETIEESDAEPVDIVAALREARGRRAGVLPAGGLGGRRQVLRAVRDRRGRRLRQRAAGLHRLRPGVGREVRGRRRADHRRRHQVPGRRHHHPPRAGQAVRGPRRACWTARTSSTSAATWTSRTCWSATGWSPRRSPRRRPSPRTSTTTWARANVHIGPSDYVQWLDDRKWAYVRLEGRAFGDVPLNMEYKLEVWDSPNSAGIIIDAIRAAKIAKDRGIGGPLISRRRRT